MSISLISKFSFLIFHDLITRLIVSPCCADFINLLKSSSKLNRELLQLAEITLLKQKYLEAIFKYSGEGQPLYSIPKVASALERKGKGLQEGDKDNGDVVEIVKTLERLEKLCETTEFNSLCLCLTLNSFEENSEYASWSVCKGRLDSFNNVCEAIGPAFGYRQKKDTPTENKTSNEESSVSKLAAYFSRGLAARDQTIEEMDNEWSIHQQHSCDTAEIEVEKYVEDIAIPIIMNDEEITVDELPSVKSIFSVDTHRTHDSGSKSVFLTETPEPLPPPVNLANRDGPPIPNSDMSSEDVGFVRSSVPPPPPTNALPVRSSGGRLSSNRSSVAPESRVRLPGGGYMKMDVKPHEPAGVVTNAYKEGEKKQAVAWTLELDDGTTNLRPKPRLPSDRNDANPPSHTWKESTPITTSAAMAAGTLGDKKGVDFRKVDKYEEEDLKREQERKDAKKGATIRLTTEAPAKPTRPQRGSKIPGAKSLAQIKQEGRKKVIAMNNAEQVVNEVNNEKKQRPLSARSTSSHSSTLNRQRQAEAIPPPLPAKFEENPIGGAASMAVNDNDDSSIQPSVKSGSITIRSSAELDSITNQNMVVKGKAELIADTSPELPVRISTDLDELVNYSEDPSFLRLPSIERSPVPSCLMELECPVRAVKRIPLANVRSDDREIVVVFGTNQKSLKMGKFSENSEEFLLLQEWDNSHNGSVYCLDVLGKLGKSETCLIATGSNDKSIRIFRADTGEVSAPIKGHNGTIRSMKFCKVNDTRTSQILASVGSGDCRPRVWDLGSYGGCKVLDAHPNTVHACAWVSRDVLITGCENGVVIIHDLLTVDEDKCSSCVKSIQTPSSQPVFSLGYIKISEKVGLLVIGCGKGYMHVVSIKQKGIRNIETRVVCSRVAHEDDIRHVHVDPVAHQEGGLYRLLTTSFDQSCNLWSVEYNSTDESVRCSVMSTLTGHGDKVLCGDLFSWSNDREELAALSSGADGKILHWPLVRQNIAV